MTKRVLLLIEALNQGGAERQLSYLASGLNEKGLDVRLITFYKGDNFYKDYLNDNGVKAECLNSDSNKLKRIIGIRKLIKKWKPDLVISFLNGANLAACIARMFTNFNLAVSERNTTQILTKKEKLKFFLYRWADRIVPNSFSQAEFIEKNYPNLMPKVKVITNMIDINKFSPYQETIKNDVPEIITTARVTPQKNVLTYLEAIAELKRRRCDIHFNWYGRVDDDGTYWQQIQDKIKELGISNYVTFHGPTKNILEKYHKSDIFFLPSIYEGFPNVLCEAMACGLPSIATKVCDSPRILQDERWLVDPKDPIKMADALQNMINLSDLQKLDIVNKNRKQIMELCSEETFIKNYLNLLS